MPSEPEGDAPMAFFVAAALIAGVAGIYTYDVHDWRAFAPDGLVVVGPASVLR